MRFLFILVLVLTLFMAVFAAFILPREQLNLMVAQMPSALQSAWESTGLERYFIAESRGMAARAGPDPDGIIMQANGVPIGRWMYHCDRRSTSDANCTITHQISENGKIKFSWQIVIEPSGKMTARWQTATGIQVKDGIVLETSGQKPLTLPYSKCVSGYCESAAELNPKFLETLLKTERTTATIHDSAGEPVTYAISVDGLATSLRMLGNSEKNG